MFERHEKSDFIAGLGYIFSAASLGSLLALSGVGFDPLVTTLATITGIAGALVAWNEERTDFKESLQERAKNKAWAKIFLGLAVLSAIATAALGYEPIIDGGRELILER